MKGRVALAAAACAAGLALPSIAGAWSVSGGKLVEDFSTVEKWDAGAGTGLWTSAGARAGAVVAGDPARPLDFGDGRDGALVSASGEVVFDTDSRDARGFQYTSISITGGSIRVVGSRPLVIRSLGSVVIVPGISVSGPDGAAADSGGAGATGVAGGGRGGAGGAINTNGAGGVIPTGGTEPNGGATGAGNAADAAQTTSTTPIAPFETAANFNGGTGGGGGGGSGVAVGGGGGAGGGVIRILAAGNLTLGQIRADGGNGGLGATAGACTGSGSAGTGGAVWLQALGTLTAPVPTVNEGTQPVNPCGGGGNAGGVFLGLARADASSAAGAMALDNSTAAAAPSQTYFVQSGSYDLSVLNADFIATPSITANPSGSVSISYAGSSDGSTFSDFTSDLSSLSGRDYRYLKFRASITTASVAGASPTLSRIEIPYREKGPGELKLGLLAGCGSTRLVGNTTRGAGRLGPGSGGTGTLAGWLGFWALALATLAVTAQRARPGRS